MGVVKKYQNPAGGLNAAGRAHFKKTTGATDAQIKANENWIYICKNNNCALPVQTIAAALPLI